MLWLIGLLLILYSVTQPPGIGILFLLAGFVLCFVSSMCDFRVASEERRDEDVRVRRERKSSIK